MSWTIATSWSGSSSGWGEASSIFDVFDPEGFFLGTVDLGFSLPDRGVPSFVGDTIIAVTPGDLDLPYLVRATIKRPRERQSLRRRPR